MSRVALVTGGTRGIGEAICLMLQKEGYNVVANYAGNDEKAKAFSEATGIPVYKETNRQEQQQVWFPTCV